MTARVRVLVVDDSAFFRRRIASILEQDPDIEVVGAAADGLQAVNETRRLKPDVITMDVEMPVMDGISAVRRIMSETPTAILMFSSLTHQGARSTLEALDAGAVDFLPKQLDAQAGGGRMLVNRVKAIGQRPLGRSYSRPARPQAATARRAAPPAVRRGQYKLLAIGASTGGPVAIQSLLTALPASFPVPILLVVHMPASFTPAYAERLNSQCRVAVKEAADGDSLRPGQAYLAPGGMQMVLERQGNGAVVRIRESLPGQTYKPSVDVTFGSVARLYPDSALAVILTGMGADGSQGARALKQGGSGVWSQDEASCVVYGMPQAVEKAGISDRVLPLNELGPAIAKAF